MHECPNTIGVFLRISLQCGDQSKKTGEGMVYFESRSGGMQRMTGLLKGQNKRKYKSRP